MTEPELYKEAFPVGSKVRVVEGIALKNFQATWKYHHALQPEQLALAGRVATVEAVGFYHGGDVVYTLDGLPGSWLEPCLQSV
jgi:hypothetical protein